MNGSRREGYGLMAIYKTTKKNEIDGHCFVPHFFFPLNFKKVFRKDQLFLQLLSYKLSPHTQIDDRFS